MRRLIAALAVALAWTVPARAEISQHVSRIYCAPTAEMEGSLASTGLSKFLQGDSGSTGKNIGQIWTDKSGNYFVVQVVPSVGLSCVVLGGSGLKKFQNSGDT